MKDNVENSGTARQAKEDSIQRRMRIACWIRLQAHPQVSNT